MKQSLVCFIPMVMVSLCTTEFAFVARELPLSIPCAFVFFWWTSGNNPEHLFVMLRGLSSKSLEDIDILCPQIRKHRMCLLSLCTKQWSSFRSTSCCNLFPQNVLFLGLYVFDKISSLKVYIYILFSNIAQVLEWELTFSTYCCCCC